MRQQSNLSLVVQPEEFFRDLVTQALDHQKIRLKAETEFYLVRLLSQFMVSDRLYPRDAEGHTKEEPLALMVKEALEQPVEKQGSMFRHVGDISLYTAGFFQDSLTRKLVDVDYYIGLGGAAYRNAAARADAQTVRQLFGELAEKFSAFVDVLAEVSDKTGTKTEKDLLRLYDLWVRTRSERAARQLQEAGILPNSTVKKDIQ